MIIEGIFAPSPTFAHPLPLFAHPLSIFAHPLPLFAHPVPLFAHPLPFYSHFTLNTYTIQAQPLMKLRIPMSAVEMSLCPTTALNQSQGGRSTYHHMNSITGRSICHE